MNNRRMVGVVVDAGHGGVDGGATGNGLVEKNLNLQAANYMFKRLTELGIPAYITRSDDTSLSRQDRINNSLSAFGKDKDVILVSNHINAGGGEGAEIVYALRNNDTLAKMMLENIGKKGQKMRKVYQRRLPEDPNLDYYYIIRDTNPLESLLVEYGFIDNKSDAAKLKSNLNNYVEAVVEALANYLDVPYSKPGDVKPIPSGDYYTVQRGDTLYKIANLYNISVDELKKINNLNTNTISVGQKLLVNPSKEGNDNYITYTVEAGDSLSKLARVYNTTVDEIKRINNLTSNTIVIGEELLLPNNKQEEVPEDVDTSLYVVKRGDSLWKIARDFNITVDEIISLNNLETINLQIGQTLKIPGKEATNIYTVKSGDSLWSIARTNNTTVDKLKEVNSLTSNLISIGQQLIIPNN